MSQSLSLLDEETRDDLRQFLERLSRAALPEVRLLRRGGALAVFGCTQAPAGLLDSVPVVLGMRAFALQGLPAEPVDLIVSSRALLDRLANMRGESLELVLPDNEVTAPWAGVLPPRGGWEMLAALDAASLVEVSRQGVERVAAALPDLPVEAVVRTVRAEVWGAEIAPGVPAAAAFAAESLGFLRGGSRVMLAKSRAWMRLATPQGEVLVRRGLG